MLNVSDDQREARLRNPTLSDEPPRLLAGELTIYDLEQIITAVRRAREAKLRFEGALHAGRCRVYVKWKPGIDQRDGDELVITKITGS